MIPARPKLSKSQLDAINGLRRLLKSQVTLIVSTTTKVRKGNLDSRLLGFRVTTRPPQPLHLSLGCHAREPKKRDEQPGKSGKNVRIRPEKWQLGDSLGAENPS